MKVECAWCGFVIENSIDGPTSHGICPKCKKKMLTHHQEDESMEVIDEDQLSPENEEKDTNSD